MEICTVNTDTLEEEIEFSENYIVLVTKQGKWTITEYTDGSLDISAPAALDIAPRFANVVKLKCQKSEAA